MHIVVDAILAAHMFIDDFQSTAARLQENIDKRTGNRNHVKHHIGKSKIYRRTHFMIRHAQLPPHAKSLHRQKKPGNIPDKRNQRQYGINTDSLFGKRNAKQTIRDLCKNSLLTKFDA